MSKYYYKRNLPHYQPPGGEFFITFRLANSLPKSAILSLKKKREAFDQIKKPGDIENRLRKKYFQKFNKLLDGSESGPTWLNDKKIAQIVSDKIHDFDNLKYILICYCIMPNHVHLLFKHLVSRDKSRDTSKFPITNILRLIKGATARKANKVLELKGQFWHRESYDHLVRSSNDRDNIIRYILENPVKARLVNHWEEWEGSFCKKEYLPVR